MNTSYFSGTVRGTATNVGGLAGWNGGFVEASYNTGPVTGGTNVGGLEGGNDDGATVEASYNVGVVTGVGKVGG